jgi:cytochrome c-type biogenesis protein CcmH/NrfG
MNRLKLIALVLPLLLASCDEEITAKEAAIRQEVAKRTETIREEMKSDQDRRFTIRVVALSLLAGGSLFGLYRLGGNARWLTSREQQEARPLIAEREPDRQAERVSLGRRVIEPPANDPHRHRNL